MSTALKIETVDEITAPMRGRGPSADTLAVRAELEAQLKDRKGRSFSGVSKDDKEKFSRLVRNAGKMTGKPEIEVSTRFDPHNDKLLWGPKEVMEELQAKTAAKSNGKK